jgi:hypothetical protein
VILIPYIIEKPLEFDFDPDTGLLSLVGVGSTSGPVRELGACLMLTPKVSQALLADLPRLEAVLLQASRGPTKPRSVQ